MRSTIYAVKRINAARLQAAAPPGTWNNGAGSDASLVNGWIGIDRVVSATRTVPVGRWPATSTVGAFGMPNTFWYAYPAITLPAGTYRVVDSDHATWSYTTTNSFAYLGVGTDWEPGKGFSQIMAHTPVVSATTPASMATGVAITSPVTLTFDGPVQPGPAWSKITLSYLRSSSHGLTRVTSASRRPCRETRSSSPRPSSTGPSRCSP